MTTHWYSTADRSWEVFLPALIAAKASEAMVRIAAGEEAFEGFGFGGPMDQADSRPRVTRAS